MTRHRGSICCATRCRSSKRCSSGRGRDRRAQAKSARAWPTAAGWRRAARAALEGLYESEQAQRARSCWRARRRALRTAGALDARLAAAAARCSKRPRVQRQEVGACAVAVPGIAGVRSAARQEAVERRLAAIEELARKHRVEPADLLAWHGALQRELSRHGKRGRRPWHATLAGGRAHWRPTRSRRAS